MVGKSSTALLLSQATLHCPYKGQLYYADMTIGKRIKIAREDRKLGQEAIAKAAGVSKQAVYQWETQGIDPTPDKLPALRQVLKVTFAWLLAGDGPPPDADSVEVRMDELMVDSFKKKPRRADQR
jgi:transcriptional regulator with XRE-family HTH domain